MSNEVDRLPLEFLQLPEFSPSLDVPLPLQSAECFSLVADPSNRIRSYLRKLKQSTCPINHDVRTEKMIQSSLPHEGSLKREVRSNLSRSDPAVLCFASHGSLGVVDLGATKTVIGSNHVQELLDHLHPDLKSKIYRCKCEITFRFGNHGTLKSHHALVIPIHGFHLKVAVVQGSTPFLLSNTHLRALGAVIDTSKKELFASKIDRVIPLHLTEKGLFLLDLNDLASGKPGQTVEERFAETHTVTEPKDSPRESKGLDQIENSENHNDTERVDNSSESQSNIVNPQVSRSEDHELIDTEANDPSMVATQEDQSHRSFARSFSLPNRTKHHVDIGQETPSSSGAGGRDHAGPQPVLDSGPRKDDDPIWKGPLGRDLQGGVGQRPRMGRLVHFPPGEIAKDSTSSLPALCRIDGGACGIDPEGNPCEDLAEGLDRSWSGSWEVIPIPQSKGQGHGNKLRAAVTRIDDSRADGRACRGERGARSQRFVRDHPTGRDGPRGSSGDTDASYGECPLASDQPPGEPDSQDGVEMSDRAADLQLMFAGDVSSDCLAIETMEQCRERKPFNQLLHHYSLELQQCINQNSSPNHPKKKGVRTVFEVFCGSKSQLSHQCQQLGLTAVRFSRDRCNLQSAEGRKSLFQELIDQEPRHLWFSPSCGPWSGWSNLNGSKSLDQWDQIHKERLEHLEQIALGMVLLRYQLARDNDFHWEQPKTSLMLRLPYLKEA